MACSTCQNGSALGCQNHGHCQTGGCNKLNSFDWLAIQDFEDPTGTDIIEVSFKKAPGKNSIAIIRIISPSPVTSWLWIRAQGMMSVTSPSPVSSSGYR